MIAVYRGGKLVGVTRREGPQLQPMVILDASMQENTHSLVLLSMFQSRRLPKIREPRRLVKSMIVECPECDADVTLPTDTDLSDIVECDDCGISLEVVGLEPLEVEVFDDDEDYD